MAKMKFTNIRVEELLAKEAELEAVRQEHQKAFDAYQATPATDPAWDARLLELGVAGKKLRDKTDEVRFFLARSKGFSSYEDMVNNQPVTPREW